MKKSILKNKIYLIALFGLCLSNITLAESSQPSSITNLENILMDEKIEQKQEQEQNQIFDTLPFCEALSTRFNEEKEIKEVNKKGLNNYQSPEDIKSYQKAIEIIKNKDTSDLIEKLKITSKYNFLSWDLIRFLNNKDFKNNHIHIDLIACALIEKHVKEDEKRLIKNSYNRMFNAPKVPSLEFNLIEWIKTFDLDYFYYSYTNMENLRSGYSFELLDAYVDYLNKNLNHFWEKENKMNFDEKMTKRILFKTIKTVFNDEIDYEILFRKEKRIE